MKTRLRRGGSRSDLSENVEDSAKDSPRASHLRIKAPTDEDVEFTLASSTNGRRSSSATQLMQAHACDQDSRTSTPASCDTEISKGKLPGRLPCR